MNNIDVTRLKNLNTSSQNGKKKKREINSDGINSVSKIENLSVKLSKAHFKDRKTSFKNIKKK